MASGSGDLNAAEPEGGELEAPPLPPQQTAAAVSAHVRRKIRLARGSSRAWSSIATKSIRYWITAVVFLAAGFAISFGYYDRLPLAGYRDRWFQVLLDHGPRPPIAKDVRLVLIDDDAYYSRDFIPARHGDRHYLATLVANLADQTAHAGVIAIDLDLRLDDRYATTIADRDLAPTCDLVDSIRAAAERGSKVILGTPIYEQPPYSGRYFRRADAYQAFGLCGAAATPGLSARCAALRKPDTPTRSGNKTPAENYSTTFDKNALANIACGYIARPVQSGEIPTMIRMIDGPAFDSFALATLRAAETHITNDLVNSFHERFPIGNFMALESFVHSGHNISAGNVFANHFDKELTNGKIVIIGGSWHLEARNEGSPVDMQDTPAGPMIGAVLQANYVESLIDQRTAFYMPEGALIAIEVAFGLGATLVLAAYPGWRGLAIFVPVIAAMVLVQWIMVYTVAVYFDVLLPLLGLVIHSIGENLFAPHSREAPN